jgi:hypothetical protein
MKGYVDAQHQRFSAGGVEGAQDVLKGALDDGLRETRSAVSIEEHASRRSFS